jgi:hypothetical protein
MNFFENVNQAFEKNDIKLMKKIVDEFKIYYENPLLQSKTVTGERKRARVFNSNNWVVGDEVWYLKKNVKAKIVLIDKVSESYQIQIPSKPDIGVIDTIEENLSSFQPIGEVQTTNGTEDIDTAHSYTTSHIKRDGIKRSKKKSRRSKKKSKSKRK